LDGGGNTASKMNFLSNEETPHCGGSSLGAKTSSDVCGSVPRRNFWRSGMKGAWLSLGGRLSPSLKLDFFAFRAYTLYNGVVWKL
jgi:hypothetical protein